MVGCNNRSIRVKGTVFPVHTMKVFGGVEV
jgi:hypothetical protein